MTELDFMIDNCKVGYQRTSCGLGSLFTWELGTRKVTLFVLGTQTILGCDQYKGCGVYETVLSASGIMLSLALCRKSIDWLVGKI